MPYNTKAGLETVYVNVTKVEKRYRDGIWCKPKYRDTMGNQQLNTLTDKADGKKFND